MYFSTAISVISTSTVFVGYLENMEDTLEDELEM